MRPAPLTPAELQEVRNSPARVAERKRKRDAKDARNVARRKERFGAENISLDLRQ